MFLRESITGPTGNYGTNRTTCGAIIQVQSLMKIFVDLCPFRIISVVRIDVERDMALTFNALVVERVLYQVHLTKPPVFELMATTKVLKFGRKSCLLSIRNIKKVALFKKFRWVCSAPAWFGGDLVPFNLFLGSLGPPLSLSVE